MRAFFLDLYCGGIDVLENLEKGEYALAEEKMRTVLDKAKWELLYGVEEP